MTGRQLTAVLDGQQRLSALNIALRGSMAVRQPIMWRTNPKAYPVRHLHLNLLGERQEDDEGEIYEFRFLETARPYVPGKELWFRVPAIMAMEGGPDMYG